MVDVPARADNIVRLLTIDMEQLCRRRIAL